MKWFVVLALLGTPLSAQENRLWTVDLELEGPLDEVLLDCGTAGTTRLRAALVAGERRSLAVPVPARVPLGVESLPGQPLPEVQQTGEGTARIRGWSAEQPAARVGALVGLRSRPRPPVGPAGQGEGGPPLAAAALALAAFVVALGLRRRPPLVLAVGSLGCVLALGLGYFSSGARPLGVRVHEAEVGAPLGLRVTGARDVLALPSGWLEVRPRGGPLALDLALEADAVTGSVRAPAAELFGLESEPAPEIASATNEFAPLVEFWLRAGDGTWEAGGSWPAGSPLPAPVPAGDDPPGWLTAGLPPGRSVLVGRLTATAADAPDEFIRVAGFPERD